jgi:hypothetical protein
MLPNPMVYVDRLGQAMPANQGVWSGEYWTALLCHYSLIGRSAWNTLLPDTDRGVLSPNPQDDSVSW